jgi:hypothetical protein
MPNENINAMLLENFGFEIAVWPIERFKARRTNPKRHRHKDLAALHESFSQTGFKDFIKYDPVADEIIDGHGRVAQALSDGMKALPVLIVRDLTPDKVKLLAILYNRTPELSSYDEKMLVENLAELRNLDVDFSYLGYDKYKYDIDMAIGSKLDMVEEVQRVAQDLQYAESEELGSEDPYTMPQNTALSQPKPQGKPLSLAPMQSSALKKETGMGLADTIFPGEPEFGIPMLSLDYMATEATLPFVKWGEIRSKNQMNGSWHFYVFDGKLYRLEFNPEQLLASNAQNFVEINYSIRNAHSRAYALGQIDRKRRMARWLQSKGKRIFVDLNVGKKHMQDNLLGIPEGWKAFATRGYTNKIQYIDEQINIALKIAGTEDIIFVVYGGGEIVEECCKAAGCIYIPERMQCVSDPKMVGRDGLAPKVAPEGY